MKKTVLILLVSLTSSCSLIYEDRSECPCLLTVDYGKCNEYPIESLTTLMIDESDSVSQSSRFPPFGETDTMIQKGTYVFSNWGNCRISSRDRTVYPDHRNELYSYCTTLDCRQDILYCEIVPIPEFAELTVKIIDQDESTRLKAEISGGNIGFGYNREILSDSATFSMNLKKEDSCLTGKTNLLRMKDAATLRIRLTKGDKSFIYPAGKILAENGYDMTEDFLDPIEIIIDTVLNEVIVKTMDWVQTDHTEIIF